MLDLGSRQLGLGAYPFGRARGLVSHGLRCRMSRGLTRKAGARRSISSSARGLGYSSCGDEYCLGRFGGCRL
jgi:hypothetical protein